MSNPLMGNMLTEVVMEKVIRDKLKMQLGQNQNKEAKGIVIKAQQKKKDSDCSDLSDDEFYDEESKKILDRMKAEQMDALNRHNAQALQKKAGIGEYREIKEEEFLSSVTKNKFSIVHFYHNDFERCKIVDKHLAQIAYQHTECKFFYLNAEKSPFFIQKLAIRMLPTIVCFVDGVAKDRIVGFEELGAKDDFKTIVLTRRLVKSGVIQALTKDEKGFKMNFGTHNNNNDDSDYSNDDY